MHPCCVKRMYILEAGTLEMSASVLGGGDPHALVQIPIPVYLFETDLGWVLFDTGCDPESALQYPPSQYFPKDGKFLPEHLEDIGVSAKDIKIIVLSHTHVDHVGLIKLFPYATVYINAFELSSVREKYRNQDYSNPSKKDLEGLFESGLHFLPIEENIKKIPITDGLTILNLGKGHGYGMLAIHVSLEEGDFVITSDAIYSAEHAGPEYGMPGVCYDKEGYIASVRFLEKYAKEHRAKLLFGHDTAQFAALKKAPRYYK